MTCTLTLRDPGGGAGADGGTVEAPCTDGQAVFTLPDKQLLPGAEPGGDASGERRVVVEVRGSGGVGASPGRPPLLQGYRSDVTGLELVDDVVGRGCSGSRAQHPATCRRR